MKKTFKRLGAVLLAAFMMLSTTVCALADEPNDANSQDQIADTKLVITDISDGDTVTAYQLVTYTADKNNYQMDPNFEAFFNAKKGQDQSAVEYLKSLSNAQITALMEEYATGKEYSFSEPYNDGSNDGSNDGGKDGSKQADSSKSVTFNLKPGYYLFTTTTFAGSNKIYMPLTAFVKIDGTNTSVYAGNSGTALKASQDGSYQITAKSTDGITIDKKTNATQGDGNKTWKPTAAAGVGDTVRFYVRVDIPAYNNQVTVHLDVKDTLTNMEYKTNSAVVYEDEPNLNNPDNMGTKIEDAVAVQPGTYTEGQQKLSFTLNYDKITKNDTSKARSVYLYYEAIVKPEAAINGNHSGVNSAYLDYYVNNNPNASHKTNPSETTVYNYAFKLYKKKGNTQTALEGAKFTLYSDEACTKALKFIKVKEKESGSTYYRPAVGDEEGAIKEIPADFTLRGLDANTYYVKETTTPSGYYAPKGAFKLEIVSNLNTDGTHSGKIDAASSSLKNVDPADENLYFGTGIDSDTYIYQAMVKNFSTPNLPTTGGAGTMLLSIGGVALMAAGAYLIFFRKKEN